MRKKTNSVDLFNIIGEMGWGAPGGSIGKDEWISDPRKMTEAGSRASILRTGVGRRQSNSRVSFSHSRCEKSSFREKSSSREQSTSREKSSSKERSSSKKEQSSSFSNGETNSSFSQEEVTFNSDSALQ